jgi:uncharacterized damage-inducible protein DinB
MSISVTIPRPREDEHAPYYGKYVERVPDGDLITQLREQLMDTVGLLRGISVERETFAYAPGKWTVRQVLGHMIDTERVMAYRALAFSRGEQNPQPSFDENAWVDEANFDERTVGDLLEEFQIVRASTIHFAKNLNDEMLTRRGTASGNGITVRALLYIIAGHERHHADILRRQYLQS